MSDPGSPRDYQSYSHPDDEECSPYTSNNHDSYGQSFLQTYPQTKLANRALTDDVILRNVDKLYEEQECTIMAVDRPILGSHNETYKYVGLMTGNSSMDNHFAWQQACEYSDNDTASEAKDTSPPTLLEGGASATASHVSVTDHYNINSMHGISQQQYGNDAGFEPRCTARDSWSQSSVSDVPFSSVYRLGPDGVHAPKFVSPEEIQMPHPEHYYSATAFLNTHSPEMSSDDQKSRSGQHEGCSYVDSCIRGVGDGMEVPVRIPPLTMGGDVSYVNEQSMSENDERYAALEGEHEYAHFGQKRQYTHQGASPSKRQSISGSSIAERRSSVAATTISVKPLARRRSTQPSTHGRSERKITKGKEKATTSTSVYTTAPLAGNPNNNNREYPAITNKPSFRDIDYNRTERAPRSVETAPRPIGHLPACSDTHGTDGHHYRSRCGQNTLKKGKKTQELRPFLCLFNFAGCKLTFLAKNEWKRHITSQHALQEIYKCDYNMCSIPDPSSKKGVFNRRDLFTQHVRRMHLTKEGRPQAIDAPRDNTVLGSIADYIHQVDISPILNRCRTEIRSPPEQCLCEFCGEMFKGARGWEEKLEHLGKHHDSQDQPSPRGPFVDVHMREWAVEQGIIKVVAGEEDSLDIKYELCPNTFIRSRGGPQNTAMISPYQDRYYQIPEQINQSSNIAARSRGMNLPVIAPAPDDRDTDNLGLYHRPQRH